MAFVTWRGGRNVVIRDGEAGPEFDAVSWPLALSTDGRVVAYQARQGEDQFCVVGGRKSRAYRSVGLPVLSADGSVVAFAASNEDGWRVVRNCKEGERYDWVGNLTLHPTGRRLAYTAERREAGKLKAFVVVDGAPDPTFDRVIPPIFSEDGSTIAYGGLSNGEWAVIVGREETPVRGELTRVFLSSSGDKVAYVIDEGSHRRMVSPEGTGPEFDSIGEAVFLKDGRVAYLAARGTRVVLVVGQHLLPLDQGEFSGLRESADASHLGFAVRQDRLMTWKVVPIPRPGEHITKETKP